MNEEIALLLKDEGFTNVFIINPPSDRDFILVSNSGGYGLEDNNNSLTNPTIQIMVVNKDYRTAKNILKGIKKYFMSITYKEIDTILSGIVIDGFTYESGELEGLILQSDTLELGIDSQLRHRISINYMLFQNII